MQNCFYFCFIPFNLENSEYTHDFIAREKGIEIANMK